jgi:hypothetical protein
MGDLTMSVIVDRGDTSARFRTPAPRRHGGPVVLATFASAPFGARAARLAVEAAAEMRSPLVVVQSVGVRTRRRRARAAAEPLAPGLAAAVHGVRVLAAEFGVEVEALRVSSPRPVGALLGFVADRRAALVVLASDPAVLRRFRRPTRRQYRRFVAALAANADCLLWTAQEPAADAAAPARRGAPRAGLAPTRGVRPGDALNMTNRGRRPRRRQRLIPAPKPV